MNEMNCKGCGANSWETKRGYIECKYCGTVERTYETQYSVDPADYEKAGLSMCSGILAAPYMACTGEYVQAYYGSYVRRD